MKFRTEMAIEKFGSQISHEHSLVFIGSCFADEVGSCFLKHGFQTLVNPFGVIFNPISIASILSQALDADYEFATTLIEYKQRYYSLAHHGSFASDNRGELVAALQRGNKQLHIALKKCNYLFITLGTANVYEWKETRSVVANCHKIPASFFEKRRLTPSAIVDAFTPVLKQLLELNPAMQIVFTVSPVRYLNFGMHENQLSKATLLLAVEAMVEAHSNCNYFPAYELVIDDLREYRFMKDDLIHPNAQAVNYIWEKFGTAVFSETTTKLNQRVAAFYTMKNHKLVGTDAEAQQQFLKKVAAEKDALKQLLPMACLD